MKRSTLFAHVPATTCGLLAAVIMSGVAQADEEVVTTVGETRVRARIDGGTGKVETAVVDLRTARPGWKGELLDPFTTVPDTADAEADSA